MNLHKKALVITRVAGKFAGVSLRNIPTVTTNIPATHVKVQVKATRINPVDMDLAGGLPFGKTIVVGEDIVGVDGSGTVLELGSAVANDDKNHHLQVGDAVFFYRPFADFGTWAQEITVPVQYVSKAPTSLLLQHAGAMALTAPTAYDSVLHQLKVESGRTILILGAGGGVGFCAVQFAVHAGCHVVAYASSRDAHKLKAAGVTQVIDYQTQELRDVLKPGEVDYILDAAGKSSLSQLMRDLQPKKLCSVKHPNPDAMAGVGIELNWFWKALLGAMAYPDNRAAGKAGVELMGQVTPADNNLLKDVATCIDEIGSFQATSYKTIKLSELDETKNGGGVLSDQDLGKVILFDE